MKANEIDPLDRFTQHVKWIEATIRKVREAIRVCDDGQPVQFRVAAGNVDLDFTLQHSEHYGLVSAGFVKLAEQLEKDLKKLEVEHSPL